MDAVGCRGSGRRPVRGCPASRTPRASRTRPSTRRSITVTIDGQTYHDGLDTLPGYDDEACTPIPNVQYDFADNRSSTTTATAS